jgi:hypothetical protein
VNHRRDAQWHTAFDALPERIRNTASKTFRLLCENPTAKTLRFKKMRHKHNGRAYFEVSITKKYRAVAYVWFWVGTHGDFDGRF